jgi:hypothetical protein
LPHFGSPETRPEECHDNMLNVMVFHDWWFDMAVAGGSESGETVWLRAIVRLFAFFVSFRGHVTQVLKCVCFAAVGGNTDGGELHIRQLEPSPVPKSRESAQRTA